MKALVTGGAGFIGSHLTQLLLDTGWNVIVLDDFSTGSCTNLPTHPRLTVEANSIGEASVRVWDSQTLRSVLDQMVSEVDAVFHLAAIVGVRNVLNAPLDTLEDNIDGTSCVLHAAARHKKPTIITSSSEVYGTSGFADESDIVRIPPPSEQRYGYAAAKLVEEYIALAHHQTNGLPVVVARLFNTIGPRQVEHYGMVVPRFIEQAITGSPITVYGDGSQRRTFTWVGDVVRALVDLVHCKEAWGQVVNIGSQENVSIDQLAKMVKRLTNSESIIVHIPYLTAYGVKFKDIEDRYPSLNKIQSLINYKPTMMLSEMLMKIIELTPKVG
jgi:UDP-glucose 4-epimerase